MALVASNRVAFKAPAMVAKKPRALVAPVRAASVAAEV